MPCTSFQVSCVWFFPRAVLKAYFCLFCYALLVLTPWCYFWYPISGGGALWGQRRPNAKLKLHHPSWLDYIGDLKLSCRQRSGRNQGASSTGLSYPSLRCHFLLPSLLKAGAFLCFNSMLKLQRKWVCKTAMYRIWNVGLPVIILKKFCKRSWQLLAVVNPIVVPMLERPSYLWVVGIPFTTIWCR